MCLIIHAPVGASIPDPLIESARRRNSDGWGITYYDGRLKVKKGLDMSKLLGHVKRLDKYERLVHLRLATHGEKNMLNCHPFKINENLWFMHNGILSEFGGVDNRKSDSKYFADNIIQPLSEFDPLIIDAYHFRTIMSEFSGYSNKFAFMDGRGKVLRTGKWETDSKNGIYLSNTYAYDHKSVFLDSAFITNHSYTKSSEFKSPDYKSTYGTKEVAKRVTKHRLDDDDDGAEEIYGSYGYDKWLRDRDNSGREYLRDVDFNTAEDINENDLLERTETLALNPAPDLPIAASCDITSLRDIQHLETEEIRLLCESEPHLMAQFIKNG